MGVLKSMKICTLMGSFSPKHINFRWITTEKLCIMTLKSYVKIEEKLTLSSKNHIENVVNFNTSSSKSENLHFHVLLLSKLHYVWANKSTGKLCVIALKIAATFEEDLTCALENDLRNLANFDATPKICTLIGFFWRQYIMFHLKYIC